jgi:hypothetical protein
VHRHGRFELVDLGVDDQEHLHRHTLSLRHARRAGGTIAPL